MPTIVDELVTDEKTDRQLAALRQSLAQRVGKILSPLQADLIEELIAIRLRLALHNPECINDVDKIEGCQNYSVSSNTFARLLGMLDASVAFS
jgi:hypothetical protein